MRTFLLGTALFGSIFFSAPLNGAAPPGTVPPAQPDAVWINVFQGQELLATVAVKPLGEVRRDGITPRPGSNELSMAPRVTRVAQTALRVAAAPLDHNTELTIDGFMLLCWRSNGTAYITVSSITSDFSRADRQNPLTTLAVAPGQSRELLEARALGAAPLTIAAVAQPPAAAQPSRTR